MQEWKGDLDAAALVKCDVVCLAYTACDSTSLEYAIEIQKQLPDSLPVVIVATKCNDLQEVLL